MINTRIQYLNYKKIIPKNACDFLIKTAITGGMYSVGMVGDGRQHNATRKSEIFWFRNKQIEDLVTPLVKNSPWNAQIDTLEDFQLSIYADGGHYTWHKDAFNTFSDGSIRKVSFSILLNSSKDFSGGELEILNEDDLFKDEEQPIRTIIAKLRDAGDVTIFPSMAWHRVRPVTKGVRYSLVGWFRGPAWQ